MRFILSIALTIALAGCAAFSASSPKPHASNVCLQTTELTDQETAFVLKRATSYLEESGFRAAKDNCDVIVRYQNFGRFQAEIVGGLLSRQGYWSGEGSLTLIFAGNKLLEDEQVVLRGYSTRQDLLDGLGWELAKPVIKRFKSVPPQEPPPSERKPGTV